MATIVTIYRLCVDGDVENWMKLDAIWHWAGTLMWPLLTLCQSLTGALVLPQEGEVWGVRRVCTLRATLLKFCLQANKNVYFYIPYFCHEACALEGALQVEAKRR